MRSTASWIWMLVASMAGTAGCGNGGPAALGPIERFIEETAPADLRDPETVAAAASYSDPERVLFTGLVYPLLLTIAGDEGCPRLVDESEPDSGLVSWRLEGECNAPDVNGMESRYEGRVVAEGDASSTEIRYQAFTLAQAVDCDDVTRARSVTVNGMIQVPYAFTPAAAGVEELGGGHYEVRILLEVEALDEECNPVSAGLAYLVDMDVQLQGGGGEGPPLRDVFQIQGRAAVRGAPGGLELGDVLDPGTQPAWMLEGAWKLSAEGYTFEHARAECLEPLEGTLTLRAGGDVATIHADGDVRCAGPGEPQCAPWSLNGELQPDELCGFTAAASGCAAGPDAPPPWGAVALLLGGLVWQGRRRRRGR